jgi:hypothetical protein
MQVADRWHIVHNLVDALERMTVRVLAQLHKRRTAEELLVTENRPPTAIIPSPSRIESRNESRHSDITPSVGRTCRLLQSRSNFNSIGRPFGNSSVSAQLPNYAAPSVRAHGDSTGSLRIWSVAGKKAARSLRTFTTRSGRLGIAVVSERPGGLWRIGARRRLRHPSAACCLARRICAGFYCDAHVPRWAPLIGKGRVMATSWVKVIRTHSGSEATTHVNLGQAFLLTRTIDSTTRIDSELHRRQFHE